MTLITSQFKGSRVELELYVQSMQATLIAAEEVEPDYWVYFAGGGSSPPRAQSIEKRARCLYGQEME